MKEEIQRSRRPHRFSNFLFDKQHSMLFLSNCTSMKNYFQLHYLPFVRKEREGEKRFVYISCLIDQYETSVKEKERNRFNHFSFSLSYRDTDRSVDIKFHPGTVFFLLRQLLSLSLGYIVFFYLHFR